AKEDGRDEAECRREEQDASVGREVSRVEPGFGGQRGADETREEPRARETECAAERGEQQALDEHLAHESRAARPDDETYAYLRAARGGTPEQEVGDIRTSDEEDHPHHAHDKDRARGDGLAQL